MNYAALTGRLVHDPETKTTKNGTVYLPLRIAVNRNDKDRNADFINCKAWGKTAEFINNYFKKGDPIEVLGRIQVDNYKKQDGASASETYVNITEVNFTLSKKTGAAPAPEEEQKPEAGLPFEI